PRRGSASEYTAASLATAPTAGKHAARKIHTADEHALPRNVAVRGSEVSRGHVLQHLLLQRQLGHQSPQTTILFLQLLQPSRLLQLQTAILLAPAVVALFFDAGFSARLWGKFSVSDCHFDLSQKGDDLLWAVFLLGHLPAPLVPDSLSSHLVQNSPGTSTSRRIDFESKFNFCFVWFLDQISNESQGFLDAR